MEYALALKLKKNIIPVAHEEFDWPDPNRLPEDCAVMALNAVKYARNQWIVAMILLNCYSRMLNAVLLLDMFFLPHCKIRYMGEYRDASIQKIKDHLQGCTNS
jgi:hypothetical protein